MCETPCINGFALFRNEDYAILQEKFCKKKIFLIKINFSFSALNGFTAFDDAYDRSMTLYNLVEVKGVI
jgi:hypothetical protein